MRQILLEFASTAGFEQNDNWRKFRASSYRDFGGFNDAVIHLLPVF